MSTLESHWPAKLAALVESAAARLYQDDRVRVLWLTGSLANGTADGESDVDLRAAIRADAFATVDTWWQELIDEIGPTVWKRRSPGPPNEAILNAITSEYGRFDIVVQSDFDRQGRALEAAHVLFDKDGVAKDFSFTSGASFDPSARLPFLVEDFIRLVGMLPIVVERDDLPIGMEGQMGLHSMLISLLLLENGIDRMAGGKRHVAAYLNDEQRAVLAQVPVLAPTMESVINGRIAYARLFLPRARRLMEAHDQVYPDEFATATKQHLLERLGLTV
jgi:hypothetical protein